MANIVSGGNKANINFNNISGPSGNYSKTITTVPNTNTHSSMWENSKNNTETYDFLTSQNTISNNFLTNQNSIPSDFPTGQNSILSKNIPSGSNSISSNNYPSSSNSVSNNNVETYDFIASALNSISSKNIPAGSNSISNNNIKRPYFFSTAQNSIGNNNIGTSYFFSTASNSISSVNINWIDIFYEEISDLKLEKKILEEAFYQFNNTYHPGLAYSDHTANVICFTPEQYAQHALAVEKWLRNKGYPTWEGTTSTQANRYREGMQKFQEYLEGEYESYYNLCFKEFMKKYIKEYASLHNLESEEFIKELISKNIFYDDYWERLNQVEIDLAKYKASIYSVEQQRKLLPYLEIMETDSYKEFANNTWSLSYFSSHTTAASPWGDETLRKVGCLPDEYKIMFFYLYETTRDTEAPLDYLKAIEDKINQIRGKTEAEYFISSISKNGKIDRNAWNTALTGGKGVLDGIETFFEGFGNLFSSEGMISSNQYAQMYILQALGEQGILDDTYQIGTSIGNMLPSIAVSGILSSLGAPVLGSVKGSSLMGASSAGNAKNQALISGNDMLSSTIYGLMTGLSETTLGLLLGNIPGLNANAKFVISGFLSEGTEEFIQTYVDAGLRASILGEDVDMSLLLGEGCKSFLYGMITSGITNGGTLAFNIAFNQSKVHISNVNDLISFIGVFNSDEMSIKHVEGGKDIIVFRALADVTSEKINKIQQIFPNAEIHQLISKDGATIKIMDAKVNNQTNINTNTNNESQTITKDDKTETTTEVSTIKNEILNNMPGDLGGYSKARYLYLELNKRLNYDTTYMLGNENTKAGIYTSEVNFETLQGNKVICKGWSELFRELLIEAGFDSNGVRIVGGNNIGSHKWVEIDCGNSIIRADATDNFKGINDLVASKAGVSTVGFLYLDKSYSGHNLNSKVQIRNKDGSLSTVRIYDTISSDVFEDNSYWMRGADEEIGYIENGMYFNETLDIAKDNFYSPSIVDKIFGVKSEKIYEAKLKEFVNMELPANMDSLEAFQYFRLVNKVLFGENSLVGVFPYKKTLPDGTQVFTTIISIPGMDADSPKICKIIDNDSGVTIHSIDNTMSVMDYARSIGYVSLK